MLQRTWQLHMQQQQGLSCAQAASHRVDVSLTQAHAGLGWSLFWLLAKQCMFCCRTAGASFRLASKRTKLTLQDFGEHGRELVTVETAIRLLELLSQHAQVTSGPSVSSQRRLQTQQQQQEVLLPAMATHPSVSGKEQAGPAEQGHRASPSTAALSPQADAEANDAHVAEAEAEQLLSALSSSGPAAVRELLAHPSRPHSAASTLQALLEQSVFKVCCAYMLLMCTLLQQLVCSEHCADSALQVCCRRCCRSLSALADRGNAVFICRHGSASMLQAPPRQSASKTGCVHGQ